MPCVSCWKLVALPVLSAIEMSRYLTAARRSRQDDFGLVHHRGPPLRPHLVCQGHQPRGDGLVQIGYSRACASSAWSKKYRAHGPSIRLPSIHSTSCST